MNQRLLGTELHINLSHSLSHSHHNDLHIPSHCQTTGRRALRAGVRMPRIIIRPLRVRNNQASSRLTTFFTKPFGSPLSRSRQIPRLRTPTSRIAGRAKGPTRLTFDVILWLPRIRSLGHRDVDGDEIVSEVVRKMRRSHSTASVSPPLAATDGTHCKQSTLQTSRIGQMDLCQLTVRRLAVRNFELYSATIFNPFKTLLSKNYLSANQTVKSARFS